VLSGGGGRHYYFKTEIDLPNTVKVAGFDGVDFRGKGGYVVAPPSLHISGKEYRFAKEDVKVAQIPGWLVDLLTPYTEAPTSLYNAPRRASEWLSWAVDRVSVGNRNHMGFILACRLRDSGYSEPEAIDILLEYSQKTPSGDHPYTQWEASASVRQAYKYPRR
jgi:hypothetical protein